MPTAIDEDRLSETFAALVQLDAASDPGSARRRCCDRERARRAVRDDASGDLEAHQGAGTGRVGPTRSTSPVPAVRPRRRHRLEEVSTWAEQYRPRLGGPLRPDGRLPRPTPTATEERRTTTDGQRSFQDTAVSIERTFDAPVDLIWQMWTDPEHFKAWYGPDRRDHPRREDGRARRWRPTGVHGGADAQRRDADVVHRRVPRGRREPSASSTPSPCPTRTATCCRPRTWACPTAIPTTTEVHVELEDVGGRTKMVLTHVGIPPTRRVRPAGRWRSTSSAPTSVEWVPTRTELRCSPAGAPHPLMPTPPNRRGPETVRSLITGRRRAGTAWDERRQAVCTNHCGGCFRGRLAAVLIGDTSHTQATLYG